MSKSQRKSNHQQFDREEKAHHSYKIKKTVQDKKLLRNMDKLIRSKDFKGLIRSEEF